MISLDGREDASEEVGIVEIRRQFLECQETVIQPYVYGLERMADLDRVVKPIVKLIKLNFVLL